MTLRGLSSKMGLSKTTITTAVATLIKRGLLRRVGPKKGGHWEIVKESMDPDKGAIIELNAENPSLTTPNTRKGLIYQLREGETIGGMRDGDSTICDGNPWSPEITVKGGSSAFYSISVGK